MACSRRSGDVLVSATAAVAVPISDDLDPTTLLLGSDTAGSGVVDFDVTEAAAATGVGRGAAELAIAEFPAEAGGMGEGSDIAFLIGRPSSAVAPRVAFTCAS